MTVTDAAAPSFAVLFKIHDWDDFIVRQLSRLQEVVADDHIFVVYDQTHSDFSPETNLKTFAISEGLAEKTGLLCFPQGSTFWYNNDYPLYLFISQYPQYNYAVMYEYDCVVRNPIFDMIIAMRDHGLDFMGEKIREAAESWHWRPSIAPHYPEGTAFEGRLACFSIFSMGFIECLMSKRLHFSTTLKDSAGTSNINGIPLWPFGEGLIGVEISENKLLSMTLSDLGIATDYDWAPPVHESHIRYLDSRFIHPVLDTDRFLSSIKNKLAWKPHDIFDTSSSMHRWFAKMPLKVAVPILVKLFSQTRDWKALAKLAAYVQGRIRKRLQG